MPGRMLDWRMLRHFLDGINERSQASGTSSISSGLGVGFSDFTHVYRHPGREVCVFAKLHNTCPLIQNYVAISPRAKKLIEVDWPFLDGDVFCGPADGRCFLFLDG